MNFSQFVKFIEIILNIWIYLERIVACTILSVLAHLLFGLILVFCCCHHKMLCSFVLFQVDIVDK